MIEQKTVRNLSDANCKTSPVLETSDHGLNPVATLPFPTDVFERFLPPPGRPCLIAFFFQSTTGRLKESLIEALMR